MFIQLVDEENVLQIYNRIVLSLKKMLSFLCGMSEMGHGCAKRKKAKKDNDPGSFISEIWAS